MKKNKMHSFVWPPGNYMQTTFRCGGAKRIPIACIGLTMQHICEKCSSVPWMSCIRVNWHCAQLTNIARCDQALHPVINDEILTQLCDIALRCVVGAVGAAGLFSTSYDYLTLIKIRRNPGVERIFFLFTAYTQPVFAFAWKRCKITFFESRIS